MHPNQIIARPARRGLLTAVILSFAFATGCSGGSGGGGTDPDPVPDTRPNAFSFTDQSGVALDTLIESNAITVGGIDAAADISITGGEYSIGGGAFTDANGTVSNGQEVAVRVQSATTPGAVAEATLTIGGVSDTFSVTTANDPSGYYTGSAAVMQDDDSTPLMLDPVYGLITEDRFLMFSTFEAPGGADRSLTYEATNIELTGTDYTADVTIYDNGEILHKLTAEGTVTEGSSFTMTLAGEGAGNGTIELTYNASNSTEAVLGRLENEDPVAAPWLGSLNEGSLTFTFTFDGDGVLSEDQSADSDVFDLCQINGTASVIENTALYNVNAMLTGCFNDTANGEYTGLITVFTGADADPDGTLVLIFSDGTLAGAGNFTE